EILTDMRINNSQYYNKGDYSIALYKGGSLVTQFGKYTYENNLRGLQGAPGQYITVLDRDAYLHMAYIANKFPLTLSANRNLLFGTTSPLHPSSFSYFLWYL